MTRVTRRSQYWQARARTRPRSKRMLLNAGTPLPGVVIRKSIRSVPDGRDLQADAYSDRTTTRVCGEARLEHGEHEDADRRPPDACSYSRSVGCSHPRRCGPGDETTDPRAPNGAAAARDTAAAARATAACGAVRVAAAARDTAAATRETAAPFGAVRVVSTTLSTKRHTWSYTWPVKPFDHQHPVRGFLNDPRGQTFHFGIDISAPDGTAVYAVGAGTVYMDSPSDPTAIAVVPRAARQFRRTGHLALAVREQQTVRRHELLGHVPNGWSMCILPSGVTGSTSTPPQRWPRPILRSHSAGRVRDLASPSPPRGSRLRHTRSGCPRPMGRLACNTRARALANRPRDMADRLRRT